MQLEFNRRNIKRTTCNKDEGIDKFKNQQPFFSVASAISALRKSFPITLSV